MPLYSVSTRSKKGRKNSVDKTPTSVLSMTSHSTSKASRPSAEKAKKENPLQPAPSKSNIAAAGFAPKPTSALDSKTKSVDAERNKTPNVFEYLDDGESDSDSDISSDEEEDGPLPAPTTSTFQSKSSYAASARPTSSSIQAESGRSRTSSMWSKNSLDSSQLSTLDTSPTSSVPLQLARKSTRKPSMDTSYGTLGSMVSSSTHARKPSLDLNSVPEAYYPPPHNPNTFPRPPFPPSPPRSPEEDFHRPNRKSRRKSKSANIPSGYGLLAWRLSSASDSKEPHLPPLYRRFEDLNHRVLLHLQDEIAQMEEDLRVLDEYEDLHRASTAEHEGTKKIPSSRRMDVQAQVYSSLHYRREEVMGSLAHKIEQYNNALSAYSKVLQNLPQASDQDVATYRSWMKQYTPVITAETRFLDYAKDLISLTPCRASSTTMTPVYSAIIIASAAILLPLLAFGMIAEFSGRILLVAVVGGAAAAIASSYATGAEQLVGSQDGWRCATVYFVFMTIAAMFIP